MTLTRLYSVYFGSRSVGDQTLPVCHLDQANGWLLSYTRGEGSNRILTNPHNLQTPFVVILDVFALALVCKSDL